MRKGRKPTAAERKLLELNNLDTRQWLVITHEPTRMLVRNKSTQEERMLVRNKSTQEERMLYLD